jgi:hypothetical protein
MINRSILPKTERFFFEIPTAARDAVNQPTCSNSRCPVPWLLGPHALSFAGSRQEEMLGHRLGTKSTCNLSIYYEYKHVIAVGVGPLIEKKLLDHLLQHACAAPWYLSRYLQDVCKCGR